MINLDKGIKSDIMIATLRLKIIMINFPMLTMQIYLLIIDYLFFK